jgi:dihydrofolate synthase/folylpolyglutamate synthase
MHQRQNAALALAAAEAMGIVPDENLIGGALRRLRWPGRFEVVQGDPLIVLDGAHNGASAEALAATLREFAGGRPIHLVIGINRDKDARSVLRPLLPLAERAWATQTADNPRALPAADLARLCVRLGAPARNEPDLSAALSQATAAARLSDGQDGVGIVCVTGSLTLVGQARTALALPIAETLW